jgi:ssRNA-specific RNase YbeY (16S rRNA maturation enzyme)
MFKFTIIDCHRQLSSKIINLFHEANKEISKLLTTQYVYDVSIVNDDEIRAINYRYRKIDKPTDVLSFAFHDNQGIKPILLGEIFINFQQVK